MSEGEKFLDHPTEFFIDGAWVTPASTSRFDVIQPGTSVFTGV